MTLSPSIPAQNHQYAQEPYFHHGQPAPVPPGQPLQTTTRYLCAAAYLDDRFADRVISELVEDEQRAVAPSYGFDLDPVVRHCFRARRLWLIQHAVLTGILALGMLIAPASMFAVLGLVVLVATPQWLRRRFGLSGWRLLVVWYCVFSLETIVIGWMFAAAVAGSVATGAGLGAVSGGYGTPAVAGLFLAGVLKVLLIAGILYGALVWSGYTRLRTMVADLAPDRAHTPPPVPAGRIGDRLAVVTAAQRGNVTLHAGRLPFLGAGEVLHAWSLVVELRPAKDRAGDRPGTGPVDSAGPIDPVELNRYVKRRVAALRAQSLPERQRVSGLTVRDQIVASGSQWHGYPLVDPQRVPYAYASPRAVEAIIRHPQASARHFLRITVGTEGKTVVTDDGRVLLAPQDQEVQASAFVHVAVEGGLLYVEFVSTVLGALTPGCHAVDYLPTSPGDLAGRAVRGALRNAAFHAVTAPLHLVHDLIRAGAVTRRMDKAGRRSREAPAYDHGARRSIREIASLRGPDTYTRALDAEKYSKMIIHRVNDAVLDHLEAHGVDTSEYRNQAATITNNTQIGGTYHGPVGMGQSVTMNGTAPTAKGA